LPETQTFLSELEATPGVHVVRAPGPFNYSRLINAGAAHGAGSVLALLNDDLLFPADPSGGWLRHVLGHFSRPDVGVVGVKLLYPDGLVQHAGMTLGPDATAVHAFRHCSGAEPGYMGLAAATRQCSAVTGACLFTPRVLFNRLGGLDEHELAVTFNDVDYCLRARQEGLRTVCTPHAWAWHLESASRGADESPRKLARASRELALFAERWGRFLEDDPHYHPLLNRRGLPYLGLRFPLPVGGSLGCPR
ncbi:MAG: glycosyltransferase family 2 protein, partial [Acidobacteriota bacterium]